jgi:antitoxin FitA
MAQFTVKNIEDEVVLRLKRRAARHGHSLEEEVRRVLRESVRRELDSLPLGSRIAARFEGLGLRNELPELHGQEARADSLEKTRASR